MGILDTPAAPLQDRRISAMHRAIKEGVRDIHIVTPGDSTSTGLTRWVRLFADKIAAQYPTHTVLYKEFNDSTNAYTVNNVTVQTGTGSRSINIWNAGVSGSVIGNAFNKPTSMVSGFTPDLVIWNYGQNSSQTGDDYRAVAAQAVQEWISRWPAAAHVIMTQGACTTDITTPITFASSQDKQTATYEFAVGEGLTVVDTWRAFVETPNYETTLVSGDKQHPTTAGSQLQADRVWDAVRPNVRPGKYVIPGPGRPSRPTRETIGPNRFYVHTGTPVQQLTSEIPVWAFDKDADEAVVISMVDWPSEWKRINVYLEWMTATVPGSTSETAVWELAHMYQNNANGSGSGSVIGSWTVDATTNAAATFTGTASRTYHQAILTRSGLSSHPLAFKLTRKATNAADTLAQDALVLGLIVERAF